jgi:1-acyl-sn-glycerol-3-phosphate acyltransferase
MGEMTDELRKVVDEAMIRRIPPDVWDRIKNMDAGQNEYGYDPFGFDPTFLKYIGPPVYWIYKKYFRTEVHDIENIPDKGAVMLVANHSGQVAIDGMIVGAATLFDKDPPRMIRSMVEYWVPTIPFFSWVLARSGQVVGTRENARILLERGGCLTVFPEGVRGISKTYDRAYELVDFGLGFMRLALENNTPIVPIGVVGGEEQIPSVYNLKPLANMLGMPAFPLAPTGVLPLPVKYRLYFGEPMQFEGASDDEDRVIRGKVAQVRSAIQALVDRGLDERRGYFF